jgi:hypothetical protein
VRTGKRFGRGGEVRRLVLASFSRPELALVKGREKRRCERS